MLRRAQLVNCRYGRVKGIAGYDEFALELVQRPGDRGPGCRRKLSHYPSPRRRVAGLDVAGVLERLDAVTDCLDASVMVSAKPLSMSW